MLARFCLEYFNYAQLPPGPEAKFSERELRERIQQADRTFHEFMNRRQKFPHLLVTKLDAINLDAETVQNLARNFGCLAVFYENYVFPFNLDAVEESQLREVHTECLIENAALTGLWHATRAKEAFQLEHASSFLQLASRNLERVVNICTDATKTAWDLNFSAIQTLFAVALEFSVILRKALTENPAYSSQELEDLFKTLNELADARARSLREQIMRVYDTSTSIQFFLEELRNRDVFGGLYLYQEHSLNYAVDTISKAEEIVEWFDDIRQKFKKNQRNLMKLHLGKLPAYLKTYRTEFESRYEQTVNLFDEYLEKIIKNAISDHGIEYFELFEEVEELLSIDGIEVSSLISRLAALHDDLEDLDVNLKKIAFDLFQQAQEHNLERAYLREVVSSISDKHTHFDLKLLDLINRLFKEFQETRNEDRLSIEQQREYFVSRLQPQVRRLIDASFALREVHVPYPVFMELVLLTTDLKVDKGQRLAIILENPSMTALRGVTVSFFVPASFDIKKRHVTFSRVKPGEKKTVGTEIYPTEGGRYHLMAMVQYEHVNESFWLPSVKVEINVKGDEDKEVDLEELMERLKDEHRAQEDTAGDSSLKDEGGKGKEAKQEKTPPTGESNPPGARTPPKVEDSSGDAVPTGIVDFSQPADSPKDLKEKTPEDEEN